MYQRTIEHTAQLDDSALDAHIRDLELQRRTLEAEQAVLVAEAERRGLHTKDGHTSMKTYLRATCNISSGEATRRRRLARLVDTVPGVGQRLHNGSIGIGQADLLARARANPRCGDELETVAPLLLEHAELLSFDDFRTCVQRWETLADLDGAYRDRERSVANRSATVVSLGAGIDIAASGGDQLTAAEMVAIHRAAVDLEFRRDVDARRARYGDDAAQHPLPRTAAQRSFDALLHIFRRAKNCTDETPLEATVDIRYDHTTFEETLARHGLAPDDTVDPATVDPATRRCETADGIVVHPDDALRAALLGHVRRVVMTSAETVVSHGRRRRLFTGTLRDAVRHSSHRCSHPGCTVPATLAQIDHLDEHHRGGNTDTTNGDPRCGNHNRLKNRGYRTRRDAAGRVITYRPDGTPMAPAGQAIPLPDNIDLRYRHLDWPTEPTEPDTGPDPPA